MLDESLVVNDFKQAKDKNKQIQILSELNDCKKEDIIDILTRHGAIIGIPVKKELSGKVKKADPTKWTPELDAEVSRLAKEGLKITEIAERLGIKKQAIYDRRSALSKGFTEKKVSKKETIGTKNKKATVKGEDVVNKDNYAQKIVEILCKCGWSVQEFNVDLLKSELCIKAVEKGTENEKTH